VRGLVRLRAFSSKGRICLNCSRLMSLGYDFLRLHLISLIHQIENRF
jgi:hypothetical protein